MGDERTDRKSVFSRSSSCSESRNVQPQSYPSRTPINHLNGTRIIIYPITEYNQSSSLHVNPVSCSANPVYCMPSLSLMEHYTTSTPPLRQVLSSKLICLFLHSLLGSTSVGWSSFRLASRTAASVKLDSGSQVASLIGYPVHIVKYSLWLNFPFLFSTLLFRRIFSTSNPVGWSWSKSSSGWAVASSVL